jgi:hypothetical protein
MSTTAPHTSRTDNEDALWQALNAQPMATTAELSTAAGITPSSARKILARWADDSTVTRHDDANGPHRWTVAATDANGDAATPPVTDTAATGTAPAPEPAAPDTGTDAANQDADSAPQDADKPPAEPTAPVAPPADPSAAPEPAPEAPGDTTPDEPTSAEPDDDEEDDADEEDEEDEEESPFGAPCPIAVGDEVANRYHRSWRGRVAELLCQDGIAACILETPDGAQSSIPPWVLVPAEPDGVPEEWQEQMDALVAAQHDRAVGELQDRYAATREHLGYLARQLNGIATALDTGTVPHDAAAPIADYAVDLESALVDLKDFRALVTDSGLLTTDEIKRAAARPDTRPTGVRATATAPAAPKHGATAPLPPGGLRGMVEDGLRDNPDRTFTTTELKRVLDKESGRNNSSGAISNALDKLVEKGVARRVADYPRTWALAENA